MKKQDFISQDLLSKIYQYEGAALTKLPSERKLAEEYGVARSTIRKSIEHLISIGIISLLPGSGIFINERVKNNPLIYNSVSKSRFDEMRYKLITLHKTLASAEQQIIFNLSGEAYVWQFCRLRFIAERCVQIDNSTIPVNTLPVLNQKIIESSLQKYIIDRGLSVSHNITRYRAIIISKQHADLLKCRRGLPAMHINSRGVLNTGEVCILSDIIDIDYDCTFSIPFNHENILRRSSL